MGDIEPLLPISVTNGILIHGQGMLPHAYSNHPALQSALSATMLVLPC
jgi:hypothetical protein